MSPSPKQIKLFKELAYRYHSWDITFCELVENLDYKKISRQIMGDSLIPLMLASYRSSDKKIHLIHRLKNLTGDKND